MAEKSLRIGDRVQIVGKDVNGRIAFVGTTEFSSGKWIGIILDEPKGKNNGSVQGKTYFTCPDNYGIFLRQSQVKPLDEMSTSRSSIGSSGSQSAVSITTLSGTGSAGGSFRHPTGGFSKLRPPTSTGSVRKTSLGGGVKSSLSAGQMASSRAASTLSVTASEKSVDDMSLSMASDTLMTTSVNVLQLESDLTSTRLEVAKKDKEIEDLRAEVKDLQEKLETIMSKRSEDREKLRDFEKTKIQLEQLLEYKAKISESQADLQKQLTQARKDAQDAIDERNRHAEEMSDVSGAIEMATLDKEMAEEKAEQLQLELEDAKTRAEMAESELSLIKAELTEKGPQSLGADFVNKQHEQQILKLKEAVLKLRDINETDRIKLSEACKELDQSKHDLTEVRRLNSKLNQQVDLYEVQIGELHEQIDAALGAEEMVEKLTEKNLTLEEKVRELQEAVDDLEKLQELNDELQETARETEQDLREEVETANAKVLDSHKKIEAMNYAIADYEQTIQKFRDHTEMLKDKIQELQKRLAEESQDRSIQTATESIDYKVRFAETKAHARAIEMELRRLEVTQANQHVAFVCAFLPDAFQGRGGDHDAVKMLLLVPRIIAKCDILASQLREKFPAPEYITRALVLKTHSLEQYTYGCMMLFLLYTLHALLQQYISAFQSCSVDLYRKCATLFSEMISQEKLIDFYIDLLRQDQLYENVPLEKLEKAVAYFESLYSVHLSSERVSGSQFLTDRLKVMGVACYAILACLNAVKSLTKDNKDELLALLDDAVTVTEEIQKVLKKIKRRVSLERTGATVLEVSTDTQEEVLECCHKLGRVLRVFLSLQKAAIQSTISQGEGNEEISLEKLKELTHEATDRVYGKDDNGPDCLRQSLKCVLDSLSALNSAVQEGSMERDSSAFIKMTPPVQLCAQAAKEKAKDMDQMRARIEHQQSDIQELRKAVKVKTDEVREMTLRKDMAEKRVGVACRDVEEQRDRLQRQLDESQLQLKRQEKEYNETVEVMSADIETLEKERRELKDQLNMLQRNSGFSRSSSVNPLAGILTSGVPLLQKQQQAETRNSPAPSISVNSADGLVYALKDQVGALTRALQAEKTASFHRRVDKVSELSSRFRPLDVPKNPSWLLKVDDSSRENSTISSEQWDIRQKIYDLTKQIHQVKVEYLKTLSDGRVRPLKAGNCDAALVTYVDRNVRLARLKDTAFSLQNEVRELVTRVRPGQHIQTPLRNFPHPLFTKAHQENDGSLVGRLVFPYKECKTESLFVDYSSIRKIHNNILA